MSEQKILAVITARGGSKRLPRKNIREFSGKPLIAWTIEAANQCLSSLYSVLLSTDDEEIAEVGKLYGAEVPFLRPAELSIDTAGSLGAVQHATDFIEKRDGVHLDWVLILQPTSPLRVAQDIRNAIELTGHNVCDSVVSITKMPVHPIFAKKIDGDGFLVAFSMEEPEGTRRQDIKPSAFVRNGAIYLVRRDVLMNQNSIFGKKILPYFMPQNRSIDIDTEIDFLFAELLINRSSIEVQQ